MTPTKTEHYRHALAVVRQLISGSQPVDLPAAIMVIDHALNPINNSPASNQAADKLLNTKPALYLGS